MFEDNPSFCAMPWVHRLVDIDGKIKECCQTQTSRGHVSEWQETWNDAEIVGMRESMVAGRRVGQCKTCYADETGGRKSNRNFHNEKYLKSPAFVSRVKKSIQNGYVVEENPTFFEFRFGSLCNLRCKMCSGHYSSAIRKDARHLQEIDPAGFEQFIPHESSSFDLPPDWSTDETSYRQMADLIPFMERVHFSGGEPTMTPEYIDFLQLCVDQDHAKHIHLDVCSNITNIKREMIDLIEHFAVPRLQCSVDGIKGSYEYIRAPGNWDKVRENLITIMYRTKGGSFQTGINMVVQLFNILDLPEILDEFLWLYLKHCADVSQSRFNIRLTPIQWPDRFRLDTAPLIIRQIALERLREWRANNSYDPKLLDIIFEGPSALDMIEQQLATTGGTDTPARDILNYCTFMDQGKKQTLEKNCPELYALLMIEAEKS